MKEKDENEILKNNEKVKSNCGFMREKSLKMWKRKMKIKWNNEKVRCNWFREGKKFEDEKKKDEKKMK